MTAHLKLRIRVSEPWDFERQAGIEELNGWTTDHVDPANEEWEVTLDQGFEYHDRRIGRLLVSPRYVGEAISRVFDVIAGFPVRIAHRQDGGWHYAFGGMMAVRHDDPKDGPETAPEGNDD